MNQLIAWVVIIELLAWLAWELAFGGVSARDFDYYRRPRDPLWVRWRRTGYPPREPPDDDHKRPVRPVKPKAPELVDN